MTFPFAHAAETYSSLAADTDTLSSELTAVLSQFDGMSGLPIDAHADKLQYSIDRTSSLALSMSETAQTCQAQDTYDFTLSQAPTPAEVAAAKNRAVTLYMMYHQGAATLTEAVQAQREADAMQAARDQAVQTHAECTAGTTFDVPEDGGWQPGGAGTENGPGGDDPWGKGDGSGGYDDDEEAEPEPTTPPLDSGGLRRLPLMEPGPVPVIPQGYISEPEPEAEAVGGTDLSSTTAAPSSTALTSPSGVYTPSPHIPTVQNQPTQGSPSWMQPTTPAPSQTQAQRPYAASQAAQQRREQNREEAAAERWLSGTDTPAAAAVMTHSVTSTPTASAPSAPTPTATPTTPAAAPAASAPTSPAGAGAGPVGGGGMAPGAAHGQGHAKAATAPKIASADAALQQAFEEAMRERPYEEPVRDGLLGPIINRQEAGR